MDTRNGASVDNGLEKVTGRDTHIQKNFFAHSSFFRFPATMKPFQEKGMTSLKAQVALELNDFEYRLLMLNLNRLRNRVIADGIDSTDVDKLLLKVAKLKTKKWRR